MLDNNGGGRIPSEEQTTAAAGIIQPAIATFTSVI
jgi:hypothetical protein